MLGTANDGVRRDDWRSEGTCVRRGEGVGRIAEALVAARRARIAAVRIIFATARMVEG